MFLSMEFPKSSRMECIHLLSIQSWTKCPKNWLMDWWVGIISMLLSEIYPMLFEAGSDQGTQCWSRAQCPWICWLWGSSSQTCQQQTSGSSDSRIGGTEALFATSAQGTLKINIKKLHVKNQAGIIFCWSMSLSSRMEASVKVNW